MQVTRETMGYDNRYSFESARRFPDRVEGVFARTDPQAADLAPNLAALRAEPSFLGVRITLRGSEYSEALDNGTLDHFFSEAGNQGVAVAIYPPHQAESLASAARRYRTTRLLVDHMALLRVDADPFVSWDDSLALAEFPNVWMKVSYFPEVAREPYPFPNMQSRFKEIFDRFGAHRLIWASNYPSSQKACSYKQSVDFVRTECDFLSDADRAMTFAGSLRSALRR